VAQATDCHLGRSGSPRCGLQRDVKFRSLGASNCSNAFGRQGVWVTSFFRGTKLPEPPTFMRYIVRATARTGCASSCNDIPAQTHFHHTNLRSLVKKRKRPQQSSIGTAEGLR